MKPLSATEAVKAIVLRMIADEAAPTGVYHFVNDGEASWADLAREIFRLSAAEGRASAQVENILSADYPTPARRPMNSVLSTLRIAEDYGIRPRPWQAAVAEIVTELSSAREWK